MRVEGLLLVPALIGCDRFLQIEGRVIQGDRSSYEVVESDEELERKTQGPPVREVHVRLIETLPDGGGDVSVRRFAPITRDGRENVFASWQINPIRGHRWDRLQVESEGYETLIIPGDRVDSVAFPRRVLIRLKRIN